MGFRWVGISTWAFSQFVFERGLFILQPSQFTNFIKLLIQTTMLADFSLFARNSKLTNSNFQVKSLRVSAEKGLALEPFRSLSWSKSLNLQMLVEEKETDNSNHLTWAFSQFVLVGARAGPLQPWQLFADIILENGSLVQFNL